MWQPKTRLLETSQQSILRKKSIRVLRTKNKHERKAHNRART